MVLAERIHVRRARHSELLATDHGGQVKLEWHRQTCLSVLDGVSASTHKQVCAWHPSRKETARSLLKKGTGSEFMADYDTEKRPRRGACTLFQQAPNVQGGSVSTLYEGDDRR
jgi:hypothetical protein